MESVKVFHVKDYASLQTALNGLCQFLTEWEIIQERIFDCKLIACELVGNVLKHTNKQASLQAQILEDCVRVKALSDTFFKLPDNIVCSGLYAEGGRGLFLVNSLCGGQIIAEEDGIVAVVKLK